LSAGGKVADGGLTGLVLELLVLGGAATGADPVEPEDVLAVFESFVVSMHSPQRLWDQCHHDVAVHPYAKRHAFRALGLSGAGWLSPTAIATYLNYCTRRLVRWSCRLV